MTTINNKHTNINTKEELSQYNKEVLVGYGKEVYQNLQGADNQNFEPGIWDFCKSLVPKGISSQMIGSRLSKEFIKRFGRPVTNKAVNGLVKKVLQPKMKKAQNLGALAKKQFTQVPKLLVGEALKWSVNSKAMPVIKNVCTVLGKWGIPVLCGMVETVCRKYLKDPTHLEKLQELPLDQLFQIDAESGTVKDAFGNVLTNEDLRDINELINRYDITSKLLTVDKSEVEEFIAGYISVDEKSFKKDGVIAMMRHYLETLIRFCSQSKEPESERYVYRDGHVLSSDEVRDMKEAIRLLTKHNPTRKKKEILNLIEGIATHITAKVGGSQ